MCLNPIVDVIPLSDKLPARIDRNGRQIKFQVLNEAKGQALSPLDTQGWSDFQPTAGAKE